MFTSKNGFPVILVGNRGKRFDIRYKMMLFDASIDATGYATAGTLGYRGKFWTLTRYGHVYRVCNGKMLTLCTGAEITTKIGKE